MLKCLKCDEIVTDGSRICRKCGSILVEIDEVDASVRDDVDQGPLEALVIAEAVPEPTPAVPPETPSEGHGESWTCANCSAIVPGNFGMCWQCQTTRSAVASKHTVANARPLTTSEPTELPPIVAKAALICSKCGSEDVIPNVRILDKNQGSNTSLELVVEGNPAALIFKDPLSGQLLATICGRCGHAELRVNNPAELLAQYHLAQKRKSGSDSVIDQFAFSVG